MIPTKSHLVGSWLGMSRSLLAGCEFAVYTIIFSTEFICVTFPPQVVHLVAVYVVRKPPAVEGKCVPCILDLNLATSFKCEVNYQILFFTSSLSVLLFILSFTIALDIT